MTARAVVGLAALNVFVLVVGFGVLWGMRGWRTWTELLRLAGLGYLLGAAALSVLFTLELVAGIPFGVTAILCSGAVVVAGGVAAGARRGLERPRLVPPSWRVPVPGIVAAVFVALLLVYFEALIRSGRLQGPGEDWDAWRAWTLRAKSIYYSGGLDAAVPSLNPTYPLGLSALQAAAFHAMGSADAVTLHQLNAFLAAGFAAAVAGLLASRVPALILLPSLLVLLLVPFGIPEWGTQLMADLPMAFFLATAAVLLALWLDDRQRWRLAAVAVLLAGAVVTKREGLLFTAVIVGAALLASWGERRRAWPALGVVAVVALALSVPWRVWLLVSDLPSDVPESGYLGFLDDLGRGWPSFRLVFSSTFDYDLWLLVPVLGVAACALAFVAGARQLSVFGLAIVGGSIVVSTWLIWSNPMFEITQDYGISPVGRLAGDLVLVVGALTPLLLATAWFGSVRQARATGGHERGSGRPGWRAAVPWAIVVGAAVLYPASMLAGTSALRLPGGIPRFPGPEECVLEWSEGRPARLVFGYAESFQDALALRRRVREAGFREAGVAADGCGRARVFVDEVPADRGALARLAERAEAVGLDPTVEAR
jgi:hypothetical protein